MSSVVDACPEHPERTRSERQRPYCFYVKHHRGTPSAAQCANDLSRDEEFSIFDEADLLDISDESGNLYGLRHDPESNLVELGARGEMIAKFWESDGGQPWHGFPLYPIRSRDVSPNRRTEPAPKVALLRMEQAGLLRPIQRKRLLKGRRP